MHRRAAFHGRLLAVCLTTSFAAMLLSGPSGGFGLCPASAAEPAAPENGKAKFEEKLQTDQTPGGVEYGTWGAASLQHPAPVLFVLASTIEASLAKPYFRQCGNQLARQGWLCVTIDLPCHGTQVRAGVPSGLGGWSYRAARNDDFVTEACTRLTAVLDHLLKEGIADPARIAVCGTSRGGYLALQFAAREQRVGSVAAFAPVTDLAALQEFHAVKDVPFVAKLSAIAAAEQLAGRPVWIVIGDQDARVDTDQSIALARRITAVSREQKLVSRVELHVLAEPRGHTTPPGSAELAASWIARQLPPAE